MILTLLSSWAQAHAQDKPVPIIDVTVTSELDNAIGEGGIDIRITGGTFFQPKLTLCSERIIDASNKWARINKLAIVKRRVSEEGALLHMARVNDKGFFELVYHFSQKDKSAHLSLTYFNASGVPVLPEFVETKGIDKFQDDLRKAITCAEDISPS